MRKMNIYIFGLCFFLHSALSFACESHLEPDPAEKESHDQIGSQKDHKFIESEESKWQNLHDFLLQRAEALEAKPRRRLKWIVNSQRFKDFFFEREQYAFYQELLSHLDENQKPWEEDEGNRYQNIDFTAEDYKISATLTLFNGQAIFYIYSLKHKDMNIPTIHETDAEVNPVRASGQIMNVFFASLTFIYDLKVYFGETPLTIAAVAFRNDKLKDFVDNLGMAKVESAIGDLVDKNDYYVQIID